MFEKEWNKISNHPSVCTCTDCRSWQAIETQLTAQAEEAATITLFCTSHPATIVQAIGNSYYCPDCDCTPSQITSVDVPLGYYVDHANMAPEPREDSSYYIED